MGRLGMSLTLPAPRAGNEYLQSKGGCSEGQKKHQQERNRMVGFLVARQQRELD